MKMFLAVASLLAVAMSGSAGDCRTASGLYPGAGFAPSYGERIVIERQRVDAPSGYYSQQALLSSYDLAQLQRARDAAAFRAAQRQAELDALYAARFRAPNVYYSAPQVQRFREPPVIIVDQRGQGRQRGQFSTQAQGGFGSGNFTRELFTGVTNFANSPAGLVLAGGLLDGAFR